jgi:hypothetical protein
MILTQKQVFLSVIGKGNALVAAAWCKLKRVPQFYSLAQEHLKPNCGTL